MRHEYRNSREILRSPTRGKSEALNHACQLDNAQEVSDEVNRLVHDGYDVTVVMHSAGGLKTCCSRLTCNHQDTYALHYDMHRASPTD